MNLLSIQSHIAYGHVGNSVALFAALGGGWWNREDAAAEKPATIGDFFQ